MTPSVVTEVVSSEAGGAGWMSSVTDSLFAIAVIVHIWPNWSCTLSELVSAVFLEMSFDADRFFRQHSIQCVWGFLFHPREDFEKV